MGHNGLLLIDKPSGVTSHDVVATVRRALFERRVGHGGTLDPMATGLLLVAIGPSTRLIRFAQRGEKRYEGIVQFGVATSSLDADGDIIETAEVPPLSAADVARAAAALTGNLMQRPPMVSAVKVNGRRLHELARQGEEVERVPRPITVSAFDVSATSDPTQWRFSIGCSPGTYVRVLASDLAESLGTIGHLVSLRRTGSGGHDVRSAMTLDELSRRAASGELVIEAPRAMVAGLDHVVLDDEGVVNVRHGRRISVASSADEVAALDREGRLVAVLVRRGDTYQPDVVMAVGDNDERG